MYKNCIDLIDQPSQTNKKRMIYAIEAKFDAPVPNNGYSYYIKEYKGQFTLEWNPSIMTYETQRAQITNNEDFLKVQHIAQYYVPVSYRDGVIEIHDGEPDSDQEDYDDCWVQERDF